MVGPSLGRMMGSGFVRIPTAIRRK